MKNFTLYVITGVMTLSIIFSTQTLSAASIMVTNTNNAGAGSLRQAIISASPGDSVIMDPILLINGSDTINLLTEITINKNLYIQGVFTSYDTLYISGQSACRIFNMSAGNVTLYRCTFVNGFSAANGGAIYRTGGTLVVNQCNFSNNFASAYGGAISNNTAGITINHSTFIGNNSVSYGGAIYTSPGSGHVITGTTFKDNHSDDDGGALYGFVSNIDFHECTFIGNSAVSEGGAIYDWGSAVILNITNCTIIQNTAASSAGVDCWGSSVVVTIGSSIIAGNVGTQNVDVWGAGAMANSNGYNYFGDAAYMGAVPTDNLSTSLPTLLLATIQDNGLYTFTCMPQTGSPVIDDGTPADLTNAQNGVITDGARDAGAAENYTCPVMYSSWLAPVCFDYTVPSGDETYTDPGVGFLYVTDTIANSCGTDSIMTIIILFNAGGPDADVVPLPDVNEECEVTLTAPTATACDSSTVIGTTGTTFPITTTGTTVVTWTYTDGFGNTTTQDQIVTITGIDNSVSVSGFTLTANSTTSTYQWVDCNQSYAAIPGETNQDFTPSANGSYAVILTNGACSDTSACIDVNGIGFNENLSFNITLYPNPTTGNFRIAAGQYENLTISVHALDGKEILRDLLILNASQEVNLGILESGIYFVSVVAGENRQVLRLVVE